MWHFLIDEDMPRLGALTALEGEDLQGVLVIVETGRVRLRR